MLIKAAEPLTTSDTKTVSEWTRQMATLPQASKLATRILLLTLLFEVTGIIVVVIKCQTLECDGFFWWQKGALVLMYHLLFSVSIGTEAVGCQSSGEQWNS